MQTMQSENYVPGVSGWKIDLTSGVFELADETVKITGADPKAVYCGKSRPKVPTPFVVIDGVTYISQAEVERASITGAKIADVWSVKMQATSGGQYVAAGIGLGHQHLFSADEFAIKEPSELEKARGKGAGAALDFIASAIEKTDIGKGLSAPIADQVREVIRAEIKPGGLLHRN